MAMKTPKTMTVSMPNEASSCVRMLRVRNHACMFARRFAILAAKVQIQLVYGNRELDSV
jgi:hypothetical protein